MAERASTLATVLKRRVEGDEGGIDGALAIRQTLPLVGLRAADLDWTIKMLGWRATEAQRQLGLAPPVRH